MGIAVTCAPHCKTAALGPKLDFIRTLIFGPAVLNKGPGLLAATWRKPQEGHLAVAWGLGMSQGHTPGAGASFRPVYVVIYSHIEHECVLTSYILHLRCTPTTCNQRFEAYKSLSELVLTLY